MRSEIEKYSNIALIHNFVDCCNLDELIAKKKKKEKKEKKKKKEKTKKKKRSRDKILKTFICKLVHIRPYTWILYYAILYSSRNDVLSYQQE